MAKLLEGTWVLVADGEKALFMVNDGDSDYPELNVRRKDEQEKPTTREHVARGSDRVGGGPEFAGTAGGIGRGRRSAVEQTDWHTPEESRFAEDLAEILYKRAHAGAFKRIVLVAPPRVLGELRGHLHKEVAQRVVGEIAKDLTNHPVDEIERIVAGGLAEA